MTPSFIRFVECCRFYRSKQHDARNNNNTVYYVMRKCSVESRFNIWVKFSRAVITWSTLARLRLDVVVFDL